MKEIKFRIWDCGLKKMSYSPLFSINTEGKLFYGNSDVSDYKDIIMQYTGLKDKNGVDIYEGDILRCWGGASHYGVYEFDSTITITDIRYVNWEELNCHDEIYILGNVHNNA